MYLAVARMRQSGEMFVQIRDRDSGSDATGHATSGRRAGVWRNRFLCKKKKRGRQIPGIAWRGCDYKNRTNYFYGDWNNRRSLSCRRLDGIEKYFLRGYAHEQRTWGTEEKEDEMLQDEAEATCKKECRKDSGQELGNPRRVGGISLWNRYSFSAHILAGTVEREDQVKSIV